jgi:hypothetical protein
VRNESYFSHNFVRNILAQSDTLVAMEILGNRLKPSNGKPPTEGFVKPIMRYNSGRAGLRTQEGGGQKYMHPTTLLNDLLAGS